MGGAVPDTISTISVSILLRYLPSVKAMGVAVQRKGRYHWRAGYNQPFAAVKKINRTGKGGNVQFASRDAIRYQQICHGVQRSAASPLREASNPAPQRRYAAKFKLVETAFRKIVIFQLSSKERNSALTV